MSADPRFFRSAGPFSHTAILAVVQGRASGDPARAFEGVAALDAATEANVSFCESPRYLAALRETRAGAVLVAEDLAEHVPVGSIAIICEAPATQFARLAAMFHPAAVARPNVHPTALIAPSAMLDEGCDIGPYAVIEEGARIGPRCRIGAFSLVGQGVVLGSDCLLQDHVSISHAICGDRVVLAPGARVGQEGFGFSVTREGRFVTAPQLGLVELGDDVHVGANSCIDRGSLANTVIGPGSRLDNLVQVGHNVRLGRGCVLVAQVGVSGSSVLGDYVSVGGQAGIADHVTIGNGARIGAQSGVMADVPARTEVVGSPSMPKREAMRSILVLQRLAADTRHLRKREAE